MLEALITSKTRIKLLLKFFLNSSRQDYLRNLESDLGENTNSIRTELNKLEESGLLISYFQGNKRIFQSNVNHPLFQDIHNIIMKTTGLDDLITKVLCNVGDLNLVYLTGELAKGNNSDILDLILVGEINRTYLNNVVMKAEKLLNKKIRFLIFDSIEYNNKKSTILKESNLLLWKKLDQ